LLRDPEGKEKPAGGGCVSEIVGPLGENAEEVGQRVLDV
jgi:hypothetical protein